VVAGWVTNGGDQMPDLYFYAMAVPRCQARL